MRAIREVDQYFDAHPSILVVRGPVIGMQWYALNGLVTLRYINWRGYEMWGVGRWDVRKGWWRPEGHYEEFSETARAVGNVMA